MALADSSMARERKSEERSLFFRERLCGYRGSEQLVTGEYAAFNIGKDQWKDFVLEGVPAGVNCVCETTCAFTPLNIDLFSHTTAGATLDTGFAWDATSMGPDSEELTTINRNEGSSYDCYAFVYGQVRAEGCFVKCNYE